jgi:hypothetical protein
MNPAKRPPAEVDAKARRLKDLSQVYFSGPVSRRAREGKRPVSTNSPGALVPAANLAGEAGRALLSSLRRGLESRGHPSLEIASENASYKVCGEEGPPLSGGALLQRIHARGDPPLLLFVSEGIWREDLSLLKNGDTTLLLFGPEVPDLRNAYSLLKQLAHADGGTLPVLVPVGCGDTPWGRLAPARLAEAAARFLGWRLPVWTGDPEEVSGLLAERLERMRGRREGGIGPFVHRLRLVLGEAS